MRPQALNELGPAVSVSGGDARLSTRSDCSQTAVSSVNLSWLTWSTSDSDHGASRTKR
jgi:hypothetical protein